MNKKVTPEYTYIITFALLLVVGTIWAIFNYEMNSFKVHQLKAPFSVAR